MPAPYIIAAFLCEKVVEERDGVLTFVRVVNQPQIESRFEVNVVPVEDQGGSAGPGEQHALVPNRGSG